MTFVSQAEKSLALLRLLPRLSLTNLGRLPTWKKGRVRGRGRKGGFKHGAGNKGNKARQRWPALGWEAGNSPVHVTTPVEKSYNYGWHAVRQYPPISLKTLQLMIDTGRVDPSQPIDLAALCNSKVYRIHPENKHFGANLTEEGVDFFKAKVNIEVQWASEQAIAAVERNGGVITTAYFDIFSVQALSNPQSHFAAGNPVPRRMTPPSDLIGYYMNAANRGYLADPKKVAEERLLLAQKYGYKLPKLEEDPSKDMLFKYKDPRQVFFGLEPGWIVNLRDRCIYKPVDKVLLEYYTK